jgi:FkbM family methyltransferase
VPYEFQLDHFLAVARRVVDAEDIRTVVEIGARDGRETREFARRLPQARIYTFECNPQTLPQCRSTVSALRNSELIEKAVADRDGPLTFFPIDPERTETTWEDGNPGASSLLRASGKYPVETYAQREITVEGTTLKSFLAERKLPSVDLLWMDIQGAELMALKGLGDRIGDVKLIHTEVEFLEIYSGQPLFREIKRFLNAAGFRLVAFTAMDVFSGDAVFANAGILDRPGRARAVATDAILPWWRRLRFRKVAAADPRHLLHRAKERMKQRQMKRQPGA